MGVGRKIIPRIRLTSAKDLVEFEAELGKKFQGCFKNLSINFCFEILL